MIQESKGISDAQIPHVLDQNELSEEYKDIDNIHYKKYKMTTQEDRIPFSDEIPSYVADQITYQRRALIKTALQYGLKLKAKDEDLAAQRQRKIQQVHSVQMNNTSKTIKSNSQNFGHLKQQASLRAGSMSNSKSQSSQGHRTNESNLKHNAKLN